MSIAVNDTVFVARGLPCCGTRTRNQGKLVFVVSEIEEVKGECLACGRAGTISVAYGAANGRGYQVERLDKFPETGAPITGEKPEAVPA